MIQIVIPGRAMSKKNTKKPAMRRVGGRFRAVLVNKEEWEEYAAIALDHLNLFVYQNRVKLSLPLDGPIHVMIHYHPASHTRPDLSGIEESVGDLIQYCKKGTTGAGIIWNDKQILSWDGSRLMEIDKLEPRLIINIYRHIYEPGEYELKGSCVPKELQERKPRGRVRRTGKSRNS